MKALWETRTPNLLITSELLQPIEPREHAPVFLRLHSLYRYIYVEKARIETEDIVYFV